MNWNEIEKELKEMKPAQKSMDKDQFWDDFKAKASLVQQDGEDPMPSEYKTGWVKISILACSLVLASALVIFYVNNQSNGSDPSPGTNTLASNDGQNNPVTVEPKITKTEILELDIVASHDGCYISEEEDATFIYIFDEITEEDGT